MVPLHMRLVILMVLLSIFILHSPPQVHAATPPVLSVDRVVDTSLIPGTNFTVDVQASNLPPIIDQSSGGLEGFDISLSFNYSILRVNRLSFASPLCPSSEGCAFDIPINNTLTYANSTSVPGTARLAMIALGPSHRANSTVSGFPPILFRVGFIVAGTGLTPITILQNSQLIGYTSNSCTLTGYTVSNGSFDNRPPFTISANPSSLTIVPPNSASTIVSVNATRPNTSVNATLVLSGFVAPPNGFLNGFYMFNPRSEILSGTNPSFSSVLTITVTSASQGVYNLEIVGAVPGQGAYNTYRLNFTLIITYTSPYLSAYNAPSLSQPVQTPQTSALTADPTAPPVLATFKLDPSPVEGTPVAFTPTVWCGTPPFSYAWSFGDGATSTENSATHTYSSGGTYRVLLTVTDSTGQKFTYSLTMTVASGPQAPPLDVGALLTGLILILVLLMTGSYLYLRRRHKPAP